MLTRIRRNDQDVGFDPINFEVPPHVLKDVASHIDARRSSHLRRTIFKKN